MDFSDCFHQNWHWKYMNISLENSGSSDFMASIFKIFGHWMKSSVQLRERKKGLYHSVTSKQYFHFKFKEIVNNRKRE